MRQTNYGGNGRLRRSINLPFLVFYGLGTIVGGGIYAMTGKVAGIAGLYAPVAFLISASIALITAFSYAEMAGRYPLSAGEVRYVDAGFSRRRFSMLIGWMIIFTGIVSSATLANATAGFIVDFIELPVLPLRAGIILLLGLIACWGIRESVSLVAIITLIEVGGLLLVVVLSRQELATIGTRWRELLPPVGAGDLAIWSSIFSAAFLAFYTFIGFEDMVNVAEEVKDVRRTLPAAILICIFLSMTLYVLVALAAVLTVPPQELAQSNTPLATIASWSDHMLPPWLLGAISILATINGILVQIIMSSRVLHGMANGNEAPAVFRRVNSFTRTPLEASLFVIGLVLFFSLVLDLATLAKTTSAVILFVFAAVNASLLKLKWTGKAAPDGVFTTWWGVPLLGFISCSGMLLFKLVEFLPL
ncbi:APC family permease [Emcibacter nanhaiensis]|uniref:Amino acid permease n=1 Tax=Emcibacter nanhaiensis TaxID=1505037 RepID=A0A501PMK4_9PROT|nr:APC family permease [Emcibacter nanhaiensis]TPD61720.1 amino acid permease [Emcibacter nanhaiensis]